jgi:hypothetical protein
MHGGWSTGPRTPQGLATARANLTKAHAAQAEKQWERLLANDPPELRAWRIATRAEHEAQERAT